MKIVLTQGCICDSLEINDKEEIELTDNERQEAMNKVCEWLKKHPHYLNHLLQHMVPWEGEYEDLGTCEQCGDTVDRYTLTI